MTFLVDANPELKARLAAMGQTREALANAMEVEIDISERLGPANLSELPELFKCPADACTVFGRLARNRGTLTHRALLSLGVFEETIDELFPDD